MNNSNEREKALREVKLGVIVPEYLRARAIRQGKVNKDYMLSAKKEGEQIVARRVKAMSMGCNGEDVIKAEHEGRRVGRLLKFSLFNGKRIELK